MSELNILCFGDSNTHGYNPQDGTRFNKNTRWPGRLQNLLGDEYYVIEEGLSGRTTVFDDPVHEGLSGLDYIYPCLMTHEPIDLLIIMLGTNDTKERFAANANVIAMGLNRLVEKAKNTRVAFRNNKPNILIVAPLPIREGILTLECGITMGVECITKSKELIPLYKNVAKQQECYFFDPSLYAICSNDDYMHLDAKAHEALAYKLYDIINEIKIGNK